MAGFSAETGLAEYKYRPGLGLSSAKTSTFKRKREIANATGAICIRGSGFRDDKTQKPFRIECENRIYLVTREVD